MKADQALLPATGPAKLKPLPVHEYAIISEEILQSASWLMAPLTPEPTLNRRKTCVTGEKICSIIQINGLFNFQDAQSSLRAYNSYFEISCK
jgi:hypothetical protein